MVLCLPSPITDQTAVPARIVFVARVFAIPGRSRAIGERWDKPPPPTLAALPIAHRARLTVVSTQERTHDMPAEKPPLSRDEWTAKFAGEVQSLRDVWHAGKFVKALAQQQWLAHQNEDPVKVAQAWVKRASGDAK